MSDDDDKAAVTPLPSGTAASTTTMKLLVDKASQRVLFAEAGKDVVDFIFGLLAMPVGAAASLLRAEDNGAAADALGCVANVYASVEKMDAVYMQGTEARDALIVNDNLPSGPSTRLLTATATATTAASTPAPGYNPYGVWPSYGMPSLTGLASYLPPPYHPTPAPPPHESEGVALMPPPDAGLALLPPSLYRCHACYALGSTQGSRGFVQAMASYTVMDDLTVTPASNLSTVALLGKLGVKDLDALEEKTVTVGRKEVTSLMHAILLICRLIAYTCTICLLISCDVVLVEFGDPQGVVQVQDRSD
jgi:hypothetical protein